jgi:hypothetical protein
MRSLLRSIAKGGGDYAGSVYVGESSDFGEAGGQNLSLMGLYPKKMLRTQLFKM